MKSALCGYDWLAGNVLFCPKTWLVFTYKFSGEGCSAFSCFYEIGYLTDDLIAGIKKHPVHPDQNRIIFRP
jgi:hypothetical protein